MKRKGRSVIHKIVVSSLLAACFISCREEADIPKPLGYFRIDFPEKEYERVEDDCPYAFEKPVYSIIVPQKNAMDSSGCSKTLYYPQFRATIYFTYFNVNGNLKEITKLTDDKVYEHHHMASGILPTEFSNTEKQVYGTAYELMGNSAVNYLFYLTDSTNHYFMGQLFFEAVPNYDSLQPCITFIKEDMEHLIESFEWK